MSRYGFTMSNLTESRGAPSIGLALALPAIACLVSLAVNAQFTSLGRWLEAAIVPGIVFGGLITLVTAPLQVFHAIRAWRRVSAGVRVWLGALTITGLSVMFLVVRYLVGWSSATWL